MMYKLSREAENDLNTIWLYTMENWSRDQANHYLDLILDEVEYLCVKPESGFDYSHNRKGYFRSKVKSHFIFYKVNKKTDVIEIIRVLHQVMDMDSQLDL